MQSSFLEEIQISLAAVFIHDSQFISTFSWVIEIESLARAKRALRFVDEGAGARPYERRVRRGGGAERWRVMGGGGSQSTKILKTARLPNLQNKFLPICVKGRKSNNILYNVQIIFQIK